MFSAFLRILYVGFKQIVLGERLRLRLFDSSRYEDADYTFAKKPKRRTVALAGRRMEQTIMDDLRGKRAIVSGSTQGIGRACALEIARRGAAVTLVARDASALERVTGELSTDHGGEHAWVCADFQDVDELATKIKAHVESVGTVHILVNNTGGPPSGPIIEADPSEFAQAFSNHVLCNQVVLGAVLPGMKEAGFGRIVNIVSTSVLMPLHGLGVSNTIRAAVANWAKTVASEVASFGITVNNVLPGFTDTARLQSLFEAKAKRTGSSAAEVRRQAIAGIPAGRLADPAEIAAVVGFLVSPAAAYISGVNLPVDGARLAAQ
ncbi:MAG: SDR family oxidoreductase [Phycisphaerae bacterium]